MFRCRNKQDILVQNDRKAGTFVSHEILSSLYNIVVCILSKDMLSYIATEYRQVV